MKSLWISLAALVAVGLLTLVPSPCGGRDASLPRFQFPIDGATPHTSRMAIEQARERGEIGRTDEVLYKAYSLYAPERLPLEYRGTHPEKCGTAMAREIYLAMPELPYGSATEIRSMRARPVCDTYYDTARFRIHFDTAGPHMILGWPDTSYRDAVAAGLETCWTDEVTTLGFRSPPSDGSDPDGGGGNALYDVYLQDCSGYYGYCQGAYTVPSTPRSDCTSYVVIDNDYAGFGYADATDPMKVTIAHEFCHACQFSSNCWADTWYMECTSAWAEDVVYDGINDYRNYLPYYLNYPYASIEWQDGTGLRMYGSCVWNFFLTEHVAPGIVPDIWARLESTSNELGAFDHCLGLEGTSLEEAYGEYAVWNWFTGSRDDGGHYDEGAHWPLVPAERTYSSYPVTGAAPIAARRPDHLAWNYIHMNNPGGPEEALLITYDGPDLAVTSNRAYVNTKTSGGLKAENGQIPLDGFGLGSKGITGWDDLSLATVVIANTSTSKNDMDYTVDADYTTPVAGSLYAEATGRSTVTVRWTLAHPEDVLSLDLERTTSSEGRFEALNGDPLEPITPGSYVDTDVRPGEELWYRLTATLADGSTDTVDPGPVGVRIEGTLGLSLSPPTPNPFRDVTSFEFTVPGEGATVRLVVHDVSGRAVATVADGWMGRGRHVATWNGEDDRGREVASGVYFCTLELPGAMVARKIMLLR